MAKIYVARRSEAEIQAEADKSFAGDKEKVPTALVDGILIEKTLITSRYGQADELDQMAAMVQSITPEIRDLIVSLYCDSKACVNFAVGLRPCDLSQAKVAAQAFEAACMKRIGGHNGIYFITEKKLPADLDKNPFWIDDYPGWEFASHPGVKFLVPE